MLQFLVNMLAPKNRCRHPATSCRPIAVPGGYGKLCDVCGEQKTLTTEEFYSQFGFMPHRWF